MKILITGVTGLLGSAVARSLVERGDHVIGVSRSKVTAAKKLPMIQEWIEWSDYHEPIFSETLNQVEGVIHLMGETISEPRWTDARKRELLESRVISTKNLIQAFKGINHFPKFWIQASAIGYYGTSNQIKTEVSSRGLGFLAELTAQWEESLKELPMAVRCAVLRFGVLLSTEGGMLKKVLPLSHKGLAGVIGTGYQWMSFIHLNDVSRFILEATTNPTVKNAYNLVADAPATQAEFIHALGYRFKFNVGLPVPSFILKLMLGERSQLLLESNRVRSERIKETGFKLAYPTLDKILTELAKDYLT